MMTKKLKGVYWSVHHWRIYRREIYLVQMPIPSPLKSGNAPYFMHTYEHKINFVECGCFREWRYNFFGHLKNFTDVDCEIHQEIADHLRRVNKK